MYESGPSAAVEIGRRATVSTYVTARERGVKGIEPGVAVRTGAPVTPGSPAWHIGAAGAPGN